MDDHLNVSWTLFFGPTDHNGTVHENETLDVMKKTCFSNFDSTACVRSSVLSSINAVSGALCICRLWTFYMIPGPKSFHHLFLFAVMAIHCFTDSAEWVLGWTTQAALVSLYLRSLELLIITHFYLTLVSRVMHLSADFTARTAVFCLSILFVYFTSFLVIGFVYLHVTWVDCYAKYWVFICTGHLATAQVLVVTSILLTRKINAVSGQDAVKQSQKRDLWFLVSIFQVSALSSLAYYISMLFLANETIGCSGVFHHDQNWYSAIRCLYELLVVLIPIWTVLWVFRPNTSSPDKNLETENGSFSSQDGVMLDPAIIPPPIIRNWRQRYRPINANRVLLPGPSSAIPYRRLMSSQRRARGPGIRRIVTAPSNLSQPNGRRSYKGTPSVMSPPPLATIPEESNPAHSASSIEGPAVGSSPIGPIMRSVVGSPDVHHVSA